MEAWMSLGGTQMVLLLLQLHAGRISRFTVHTTTP